MLLDFTCWYCLEVCLYINEWGWIIPHFILLSLSSFVNKTIGLTKRIGQWPFYVFWRGLWIGMICSFKKLGWIGLSAWLQDAAVGLPGSWEACEIPRGQWPPHLESNCFHNRSKIQPPEDKDWLVAGRGLRSNSFSTLPTVLTSS